MTVRSSWWHFLVDFLIALDLVAGGLYLLVRGSSTIIGALLRRGPDGCRACGLCG